jgi:PAS domain S-box-containing protein
VISRHRPDGRILYVSYSCERVLGFTPADLVGRFGRDLVHPDDLAAVVGPDGRPRDTLLLQEHTTVRLRHRDGHWLWVALHPQLLRDADGAVEQIQIRVRDITELRARDAEVRQEWKLESLGRFSAALSHEINSPLQIVGDNARFLTDASRDLVRLVHSYRDLVAAVRAGDGEEERALVRRLEDELEVDYLQDQVPSAGEQLMQGIERVSGVVLSMQTLSHPGGDGPVPADFNGALEATVTVVRHEIDEVAELHLDLGPLPPVRFDIAEVNQVFMNLVSNAVDAMRETGRRGTLGVRTWLEGDQAVVAVSDTGDGIVDDVLAKMFEPFFTTKAFGQNSGQGLPLVRSVVQSHGGSLAVDTEPGEGATFTIRLPVGLDA